MRYRITIEALLLLCAASHVQGAMLKGVTLLDELGGAPVSNVQITSDGANPTASLSDGTFTLKYPHKEPGDFVKLLVEREGLVVINDFQLLLPLPRDAESTPLTLLLCKESEREEMARRFYRLKSLEAIERNYKRRITDLEAKNQATTGALEQARNERDQAKAIAEKVAEELARLKPESTSDLYQQALSLFLAGKPEEALKLLDEEKLRRSVQAADQLQAEAKKKRAEAIQSFRLRAQILTTLFRFAEAEKTYQAALEEAPDSFETQFEFAGFNLYLRRFPNALTAYGRSLDLARQSGTATEVAKTLNNIGYLYSRQNRLVEARQAYEEALKIRRELAKKNPDTNLPGIAMILNNLGNLHRAQNQMDDARRYFEEALKIFREFPQENPAKNLVAGTLNNLGYLYSRQNRTVEARQAYVEALKIRRELAQKNPEDYLPDLAVTLNNLGALYRDENRMNEALEDLEEALSISRDLAQKNPDTYLPFVATTLNDLGLLYRAQQQWDKGRQAYEEALRIRCELAQRDPETYLPDVATTLYELGRLYFFHNRMGKARPAFEEALKIRRQLAEKNPEIYLPDLAGTLDNLGSLNRYQNRMAEARQAYEEALKIRRELVRKNPEIYLTDLALTLTSLGTLDSDQGRRAEARKTLEEARKIWEELSKRDPQNYVKILARVKEILNGLPEVP